MKTNESNSLSNKNVKSFHSYDIKKNISIISPDVTKLQLVIIDQKTRIYIALDADPELAKLRYLNRLEGKSILFVKKSETKI
jgi:hypothetical protein